MSLKNSGTVLLTRWLKVCISSKGLISFGSKRILLSAVWISVIFWYLSSGEFEIPLYSNVSKYIASVSGKISYKCFPPVPLLISLKAYQYMIWKRAYISVANDILPPWICSGAENSKFANRSPFLVNPCIGYWGEKCAIPKSDTVKLPSLSIRILSGFKSRWIMSCFSKESKASQRQLNNFMTSEKEISFACFLRLFKDVGYISIMIYGNMAPSTFSSPYNI